MLPKPSSFLVLSQTLGVSCSNPSFPFYSVFCILLSRTHELQISFLYISPHQPLSVSWLNLSDRLCDGHAFSDWIFILSSYHMSKPSYSSMYDLSFYACCFSYPVYFILIYFLPNSNIFFRYPLLHTPVYHLSWYPIASFL